MSYKDLFTYSHSVFPQKKTPKFRLRKQKQHTEWKRADDLNTIHA